MLNAIKTKLLDWNFRKNERAVLVATMKEEVLKLITVGRLEEASALSSITDDIAASTTLSEASAHLETMQDKLVKAATAHVLRVKGQ